MVQEETRDLGPEPMGEPLCAVQGHESRRKAALDRDRQADEQIGLLLGWCPEIEDMEQARTALDSLKQIHAIRAL